MVIYDKLRKESELHLAREGELSSLDSGERKMLATGSLAVLAATRLAALRRRERALRAASVLAVVSLLVTAPSLGWVAFAGNGTGLRSAPNTTYALAGVLIACAAALILSPLGTRRLERKRATYRRIDMAARGPRLQLR